MIASTHRFSPFDQRQTSSLVAARNAPGRSTASPGVVSAAGRTPHVHGEQHDDATSQETVSAVSGRLVSGPDARRVAEAVPVADDLGSLARRLERGARDAGRVAQGAEILAVRLSIELPQGDSYEGLTGSVNDHSEHAQLLADAHAVVVRMAAFPEILDVLSALEKGAEVIVRTDESHASPSLAGGFRSCKTGAVGGEHNPTPRLSKLWSGIINFVSAGHRKSSSPAHQSAPAVVSKEHHGSDVRCAKTRGRVA